MLVARRYRISGRVQRVGFRAFTEAAAVREGLLGWVRNLPDGRVEVDVEGDREAVDRFEREIGHGPPLARVTDMEIEEGVPTRHHVGFSVR